MALVNNRGDGLYRWNGIVRKTQTKLAFPLLFNARQGHLTAVCSSKTFLLSLLVGLSLFLVSLGSEITSLTDAFSYTTNATKCTTGNGTLDRRLHDPVPAFAVEQTLVGIDKVLSRHTNGFLCAFSKTFGPSAGKHLRGSFAQQATVHPRFLKDLLNNADLHGASDRAYQASWQHRVQRRGD